MIEGSGSAPVLIDPDPGGPKTYGSGSATLERHFALWPKKSGGGGGKGRPWPWSSLAGRLMPPKFVICVQRKISLHTYLLGDSIKNTFQLPVQYLVCTGTVYYIFHSNMSTFFADIYPFSNVWRVRIKTLFLQQFFVCTLPFTHSMNGNFYFILYDISMWHRTVSYFCFVQAISQSFPLPQPAIRRKRSGCRHAPTSRHLCACATWPTFKKLICFFNRPPHIVRQLIMIRWNLFCIFLNKIVTLAHMLHSRSGTLCLADSEYWEKSPRSSVCVRILGLGQVGSGVFTPDPGSDLFDKKICILAKNFQNGLFPKEINFKMLKFISCLVVYA